MFKSEVLILPNLELHAVDIFLPHNIILVAREVFANRNCVQAVITQFPIQPDSRFIASGGFDVKGNRILLHDFFQLVNRFAAKNRGPAIPAG